MGNYIMELTDEKVQLTNVIRHLTALNEDYPKGTYEHANRMLKDMKSKVIDKLLAAEHAHTIMAKKPVDIEIKPGLEHKSCSSLREQYIKHDEERGLDREIIYAENQLNDED